MAQEELLNLAARYPFSHWGAEIIKELGLENLTDFDIDEQMQAKVLAGFSADVPRMGPGIDYLTPQTEVIAYLVSMNLLVYSDFGEHIKMRLGGRYFNWLSLRTRELMSNEPLDIISEFLLEDGGLANRVEAGGIVVSLTDFLGKLSGSTKIRLRLVDMPVSHGVLVLAKRQAAELAAELVHERLSRILEDKILVSRGSSPGVASGWIQRLSELVSRTVNFTWADAESGDLPLVPSSYPPCIKAIAEEMAKGYEPAHFARFSFAAFMRMIGAPKEETLKAFSSTADYNAQIALYHISHIYGEIGSRTAYTAPGCDTLKVSRLCPIQGYCNPRAKHPVTVYKINLKRNKTPAKQV